MGSSSSYSSSSHPVKAKLTLLTWFERLRKGQRADCEPQRTDKQRTNLNYNSSEDPVSCPHWVGEPDELVMETPLAKRVIGDNVLSFDYTLYDIARL